MRIFPNIEYNIIDATIVNEKGYFRVLSCSNPDVKFKPSHNDPLVNRFGEGYSQGKLTIEDYFSGLGKRYNLSRELRKHSSPILFCLLLNGGDRINANIKILIAEKEKL